ncbi:MAG TPA: ATP-dependent RecD-like DNA helicase [Opitutales bacterium]|nr:ATP-dependent RecD-like DNA helicase [Opitutales bacterium]
MTNGISNRRFPSSEAELVGVLERIIFFNEENHFCIAELRSDQEETLVTVTGSLPGVQCGETLRLNGSWVKHPQHGRQFKIRSFSSQLPATVYGIRKYLGSGLVPGIGKVYADKIVDKFGTDTFRVITEESGLLRTVPGIGKTRAVAIKKAWDEQKAVREVMVFLQTYGVSTNQCIRLVKQYGNEAQQILRNEPYRIAREIAGIGFKTADKIAINLGYANDSPPRIDAGIFFALAELESEGNTCFPVEEFVDYTSELLEAPREKVKERAEALVEAGQLVQHRRPDGEEMLQHPLLDRAEKKIAASAVGISLNASVLPPIKVEIALKWAQERAGFSFAPEQTEALRNALTNKFSVITGGPGTGKTTILRALVAILKAKKVRIQLAAPTGRAAQRLAETAGGYAQTIHRLLRFDPAVGGFTANSESPLNVDFVIIDESSMIDARLAASLLQAIPLQAHLLLVGDIDQLPSVGPGTVLRDLMESGQAKVTRLESVFRQQRESAIVRTAHAINRGQVALPAVTKEPHDIETELAFVQATDPEECLEKVIALFREFLPGMGIDVQNDVQVLVPMHRGVVGVANLNQVLQRELNGSSTGLRAPSGLFRTGDKLIQLRNNYDKGIFNGDLGRVVSVSPEKGEMKAEFDRKVHPFERSDLDDLALAYAISIHKSQGSEYPVVVIPLLKQHYMMLRRNLLYTAVTRGKQRVILVGDPAAYAMAVSNFTTKERHTFLRERF